MNSLKKNLSVLKEEWKELYLDQRFNLSRFRYVTLPFMKSRVPIDKRYQYPDNNGIFHLFVALISSCYQHLPRTLTYLTVGALALWLGGII